MKLKIVLVLILAFFSFAFIKSPVVNAEGEELTTTIVPEDITTTTATQPTYITEAELALERAQTIIMGGLVSVGGAGTVGGIVAGFLKKKRKQVDESVEAAKKSYNDQKAALVDKFNNFQAKAEAAQARAEQFQTEMAVKYDAAITKANEQTARATAIIEKYQAREDALVAFANAEAAKLAATAEAVKAEAVSTAGTIVQEASV